LTDYTLKRSNRKTIALHVRDGSVEVRAPLKLPQRDIDRFVASKEKWVKDKLEKSQERIARRESFSLTYGDYVSFRGEQRQITVREGASAKLDIVSFSMPPGLTPQQIKAACIRTYRICAKHVLTWKTLGYAEEMSVMPSSIRINNAKSRWGSCSGAGRLNFSWRLIMADDDVIDYVVVHELAHITELNHSARFWKLVENELPDYKERKARLRELQNKLDNEVWD